jgi:6-phosphogluconolactonase/glucosamine-6-phosphate isomerase/deaminase
MTLSFEAFSRARLMIFTVAGTDKRGAFEKIFKGGNLPAAKATAHEVLWLVDRAAAGDLVGT